MREIELSDGTKVNVFPLKGRDVREISAMKEDVNGEFSQLFETMKRGGFNQKMTDELPFPDVMAINKAIIAETYGLPEEIKN